MGETTHISWADHTFNPWIGCTKVGPACDGCYAEALMSTEGRMKRTTWGKPGQRATHVRTAPSNWKRPLKWDRAAQAAGRTAFVFCASLADVFDKDVPAEWRAELLNLIKDTPHLTWLLLTKRPGLIVDLWNQARQLNGLDFWPTNAAIGCTVVTQAEADRDVPKLLDAKLQLNPAFAFVSMEPLLEAVDLTELDVSGDGTIDALSATSPADHWRASWAPEVTGTTLEVAIEGFEDWGFNYPPSEAKGPSLDWVIAGGETDQGQHKARPSLPEWYRSLRDQTVAAGVPFHFKQWGEWAPADTDAPMAVFRVGKKAAGRLLDGVVHDARPGARP